MKPVAKALAFAAHHHEGQHDKRRRPYILHVYDVVEQVEALFGGDDEELLAIAALHDVVEDTSVTIRDLKGMGFSQHVIDSVRSLTRAPGESYDDYLFRLTLGSDDAARVKYADILCNLLTIEQLAKPERSGLRKRYTRARKIVGRRLYARESHEKRTSASPSTGKDENR